MKRLVLFMAVTVLALSAFGGLAYANYGIHGGYLQDTDACAGCHRAHTGFSQLTWTANDGSLHNPLLVSSAANMTEFCYTCHGNDAPGAATNVEGGVLDATITGNTVLTDADIGDTLNGGGFVNLRYNETSITAVTSTHDMEAANVTMWGSSQNMASQPDPDRPVTWTLLSCNSCHDVHGSSNYRILLDTVNGYTVGGYTSFSPTASAVSNPDPDPWVLSSEIGYPNGDFAGRDTGFKLHKQYPNYMPDYVNAVYHVPPDRVMTGGTITPNTAEGMTGWCLACHETYGQRGGVTDTSGDVQYIVDGNDDSGTQYREKHPVNTPLSTFDGERGLVYDPHVWYSGWAALYASGDVTVDAFFVDLPLLHDPAADGREGRYTGGATGISYSLDDGLDCLTCHRAHGVDTTMTGYANSSSNASPAADTGTGGVPPTNDSALLRADNRGVCERCHNK